MLLTSFVRRHGSTWLALLVTCAAGLAHAQPVGLLTRGDAHAELTESQRRTRSAIEARGFAVIDGRALLTLLRAEGWEPYRSDASWAEALREASEGALEDAAFGRFGDVRARADTHLALAGQRLAWLGSEPALAAGLGDLCLYGVRADLRLGNESDARRRAADCLRVLPTLAPDPDLHPESVIQLLERAREDHGMRATLDVRLTDAGECDLRVQGAPFDSPEARPRGDHVISTRCSGEGSLTRRVTLSQDGLTLTLPSALLTGLRVNEREVWLHGEDVAPALHALSKLAHVDTWIVLSTAGSDVSLTLYRHGHAGPVERHATRAEGADVGGAVAQLLTNDHASAAAESSPTASPPRLGRAMAASASALSIGAFGLYAAWRSRDSDLQARSPTLTGTLDVDPAYERELESRNRLGAWSSALSAVSGALALVATPLLTRRAHRGWRWALLAVGAGVAGAGVWALARGGQSETLADGRTRSIPAVPLAPLLLTQGVSLSLVPVAAEIRGRAIAD